MTYPVVVAVILAGYLLGRYHGARKERLRVLVIMDGALRVLWSPTLREVLVCIDGGITTEQLLTALRRGAEKKKATADAEAPSPGSARSRDS